MHCYEINETNLLVLLASVKTAGSICIMESALGRFRFAVWHIVDIQN